jgi:hypothetical protein
MKTPWPPVRVESNWFGCEHRHCHCEEVARVSQRLTVKGSRRILHLLIFAGKLLVKNLLFDDRRIPCLRNRFRRFLVRTCVLILTTQMRVIEV